MSRLRISAAACAVASCLAARGAAAATSTATATATSTVTFVSVGCGVLNGGFEIPPPLNWAYSGSALSAGSYCQTPACSVNGGASAVEILDADTSGVNTWSQTVPSTVFSPGGIYDFEVYIRTQNVVPAGGGGNGAVLHVIFVGASAEVFSSPRTTTTGWSRVLLPAVWVPPSTTSIVFGLELRNASGTAGFDDACMTAYVPPTLTGTATATATGAFSPTSTETVNPAFTSTHTATPGGPPTGTGTITPTPSGTPPPSFAGVGNNKFSAPSGDVAPGTVMNYVISLQNNGGDAVNVYVADVFDPRLDRLALTAVPAPVATPDSSGYALWNIGYIPAGNPATINITIPVRSDACGGVLLNAATILLGASPVATVGPAANRVAAGATVVAGHADAAVGAGSACNAVPGESSRAVLDVTLRNAAGPGARPVTVNGVLLSVGDTDSKLVAPAGAFTRLFVSSGGVLLGQASALPSVAAPVSVTFTAGLALAVGASATLVLGGDVAPKPSLQELRLGVVAAGDLAAFEVQTLCPAAVVPEAGRPFPFWSDRLVLAEPRWEGSLRVFPSPFDPAAGSAVVQYFLEQDSRVTVRVHTSSGERVRTLADGKSRPAHLTCEEAWDGRNDVGGAVRTGVYVVTVDAAPAGGGASRRQRAQLALTR